MHETDQIDEILSEFLIETNEQVEAIEAHLVALEQDPNDHARIDAVFRDVHSIKGTCGFFGFHRLAKLTHTGENLLSAVREGTVAYDSPVATALLRLVDAIRTMTEAIVATGQDGDDGYPELSAELERLRQGPAERAESATRSSEEGLPSSAGGAPQAPPAAAVISDEDAGVIVDSSGFVWTEPVSEEEADKAKRELLKPPTSGAPVARPAEPVSADPAPPISPASAPDGDAPARGESRAPGPETRRRLMLVKLAPPKAGSASDPGEAPAKKKKKKKQRAGGAPRSVMESTVRVDVALLDSLMDLVGELVLSRNQVRQHAESRADPALRDAAQRLDVVTNELRERVMTTRMRPVRKLFDKTPRIVRDLSRRCNKEVEIRLSGRDVELDRTVIEAITDPLTHLIRNCVDHGIEPADTRVTAGKPRAGTILLNAAQEGGTVSIEIIDDGGGIDPEKVAAGAIKKGIVTPAEVQEMSDRERIELIFRAGLSTAEAVTAVSGRGVGLDVVRTNIEEIGGAVEVSSTVGAGTRFLIKIPLTLAIVPALVVRVRGERYAIPQTSVVELVRASNEHRGSGIEQLHGAPVYRLRGHLLPLVFLERVFGLNDHDLLDMGRPRTIVVVQIEKRQFGLVVDGVDDGVEIVVKPLSRSLRDTHLFSGATILGDGRVVLIVDLPGIAQRTRILNGVATKRDEERARSTPSSSSAVGARGELLVVVGEGGGRIAIPIEAIERLERINRDRFEHIGGKTVLQYRGLLLPLLKIDDLLPGLHRRDLASAAPAEPISLVVLSRRGAQIGLQVREILDVHPFPSEAPRPPHRAGSRGTLVIAGSLTELLDLDNLAARVPGFAPPPMPHAKAV